MVISTFIDYYDEYLDTEKVYERLRSDKLELSDLNSYRYTLIIGETCIDFIYRDNKIILGEKLLDYGVVYSKNIVKVKCNMDTFKTHATCRILPYKDISKLNKRKESLLLLLQNMDKDVNFKRLPKYDFDSKIWVNINLKILNLEEFLNGKIISRYL